MDKNRQVARLAQAATRDAQHSHARRHGAHAQQTRATRHTHTRTSRRGAHAIRLGCHRIVVVARDVKGTRSNPKPSFIRMTPPIATVLSFCGHESAQSSSTSCSSVCSMGESLKGPSSHSGCCGARSFRCACMCAGRRAGGRARGTRVGGAGEARPKMYHALIVRLPTGRGGVHSKRWTEKNMRIHSKDDWHGVRRIAGNH